MVRRSISLTALLLLVAAASTVSGRHAGAGGDTNPPTNPTQFSSDSHRLERPTLNSGIVVRFPAAFAAGGATDAGTVQGYAYRFTPDKFEPIEPNIRHNEAGVENVINSGDRAPGIYWLRLRSRDNDSNWSQVTTAGPYIIAGAELAFSPATAGYSTRDIDAYCGICGSNFDHFEGVDIGLLGASNDFSAIGRRANASEVVFVGPGSVKTRYNAPGTGTGPNIAYDRNGVLRFNPFTDLGNTSRSWEYVRDFADAGLSTNSELVDALGRSIGQVIVSTTGAFSVKEHYNSPGVGSGATINGNGSDLLIFTPGSEGRNTTGDWELFFDGSDCGLTTVGEKIDAVDIYRLSSGKFRVYLSTAGNFSMVAGISGEDADIVAFDPGRGASSTCTNVDLVLDGSVGPAFFPASADIVALSLYVPAASSTFLAGDYDGNGTETPGVARNGEWSLRNSNSAGSADVRFPYNAGYAQVVGDWDGDGDDTPGTISETSFSLSNQLGPPSDVNFQFGQLGDIAVVGDWNGDGVDTIGVFRDGRWLLRNSNSTGPADLIIDYGLPGDLPVVGDWDNDGTDTIGVYRAGSWRLRNANSAGNPQILFSFGNANHLPVAGDWNGDGKTTIGYVDSTGTWRLRNANSAGPPSKTFLYNPTFVP